MSEQIRQEIGRLLREVRHERGLGLEDVQNLTGQLGWPVSRSRLSMVERGESDIRLSDLYALSRSYGIPITDLIAEALVAHGNRKKFPEKLTAEELFEEGKRYFRFGFPMEAAWAFEEASRRAGKDEGKSEFVFLCQVSAGHCYERAGAMELALKRVESVVDRAEEGSDVYLRALGKAAILRARTGALGRARVYARILGEAVSERRPAGLKAFLQSARAVVLVAAGDCSGGARLALESSRIYQRLGDFPMAAKQAAESSLYLLRAGEAARALRIAQDSRGYLKDATHVEATLVSTLALAECLIAKGDSKKARALALEAARLASKHGYEVDEGWGYAILESLDGDAGRISQARRWRQKRHALAIGRVQVPPFVPRSRWGRR